MENGWYRHWVSGALLNNQLWYQSLVINCVLESLCGSKQSSNDSMMWMLLCHGVIDASGEDSPWDGSMWLLHSDSKGIWMWLGMKGQGLGACLADSYWLLYSHRHCWNGAQKTEGWRDQTARVWNRLWWPYERYKSQGDLEVEQEGQVKAM